MTDTKYPDRRENIREVFVAFARSFSTTIAKHKSKIDRYVDVLERSGFEIEEIEAGLASLKSEGSLPAPKKIVEMIKLEKTVARLVKEKAEYAAELQRLADPKVRATIRAELAEKCREILGSKKVLDLLVGDVQEAGLVGENRAAKLIYLAVHTRHFDTPGRPVSIVIKGTSSSGKSFTAKMVIKFFAPGSIVEMTGMSPKWMVYAAGSGMSFAHKFLFVHEATGINEEVEAMLRVLLSEGCIRWRTVIDQEAHTLTVEGPTGLIETTTRISVHEENETRLLSIPVDESSEQTKRVLEKMGGGAACLNYERWHAFDNWIALGSKEVVIPYQEIVAKYTRPIAPRVRRDYTTLCELVRAHALVHQEHRTIDRDGRVVADLQDYVAVHELTRDLFADAVEISVPGSVREVVEAVSVLIAEKLDAHAYDATVAVVEVAGKLGRDRRVVDRWVKAALAAGFVEDVSLRSGPGVTQRLQMGLRAMPEDGSTVFPEPEVVAEEMKS